METVRATGSDSSDHGAPGVVTPAPARGRRHAGAPRALRHLAALIGAALVATALVPLATAPAAADTAPTESGNPATVAADALPTVQIDGVAWSQVVVSGKVYVAGKFTTARPAGAAPGTSTVGRANLLAYDLASGALVSTWAPKLNGAAYAIAASPDGSKLYVGGDFTTVDGVSHPRFVALDRATGKRVSGFAAPKPNAAVKAITATASTVYLGGNFNTVHGTTRNRLAAVSATSGGLLSWKVSADLPVEALVMSPDSSRVIVGGRFGALNGVQARGSGAVSASSGAVQSWAANRTVVNYGWDAGITSLSTDGTLVFGTGFTYITEGGAGNLEGAFAADPATGAIRWIEDCHGDSYSVHANRGGNHVYVVGHPHDCVNIGGFPEGPYRYALAFTKSAVSTITPNRGTKYFNFAGQKAPRLLHFYPDLKPGAVTAAKQAAWHVTGSGSYVVMAGEFTAVNGRGQQGLVRMATSAVAPDKVGPVLSGTTLQPAATSEASGTAQVSWPTNWDRDNGTLTYRVLRDGGTTPVHQTTGVSTFAHRPRLSFTDTGLTPGRTYSYKVVARDAFGNQVTSPSVSVVVAGSSKGGISAYAREVLGDNPEGYWRLGEGSGAAQDWTGYADLTVGSGVARSVTGALAGDGNRAVRLNGTSSARLYGGKQSTGQNRFSVEAWFRTTSTKGGKIVGYGSSGTATSSTAADRHLYLGTDGRLRFGVNPNSKRAITAPTAVNDGRWHHAVGTLGPGGMRLYVDGVLRAERTDTISADVGKGYWRIGGDLVSGWPSAGSQDFAGDIDDVAVYGRALTATEVASHRSVGTGGSATATTSEPTTLSTQSATTQRSTASGSTTATTSPDSATQDSTATPGTTTPDAAAPVTVARDAFRRTIAAGWGSADLGGAWATSSGGASVDGGAGVLTLASPGSSVSARLPGVAGTDLTTSATASWDARPGGSGGWWLVRGRITPAGEYRLKVGHRPTGEVAVRLVRSAADGTETTLAPEITVPGLTPAPGAGTVAELEVGGTAPTTLRARVWAAGGARPVEPLLTATDGTAGLQDAGHVGLAALLSGTATDVPVTLRIDDVGVVRPG